MKKRLRVLVISHGFPPDMGGASNRAWNIARAMQSSGHEVVSIAAYPYYPHGRVSSRYRGRLFAREHIDGLEVIRVWIPSLKTQGYFKRLLIYAAFTFSYSIGQLLLVKRRFDIVYYVSPYPLSFFSYPAIVFGRLVGSHVFLDVADLWPEVILEIGKIRTPLATSLVNVMAKLAGAMSDLTTPITESIRERLLELGLPSGKLQVVELAIDTDYFRPQPRKMVDERLRGKFVAEYSGIIGPKYDFASLVEAGKIIATIRPRVLILIRGDGEWLPYVRRISSGADNVLVLDKIESMDRVLDYLNAADVLLCPMRDLKETSTIVPSKVLEYFSVGKPVVCSGRGETLMVIAEYTPGIMVAPDDPQALADAIIRLHDDAAFYKTSSENSRRLALERYSLGILSHRIELLARSLNNKFPVLKG
jgi:glycosyltransferase involved in cell wall biosynthesis